MKEILFTVGSSGLLQGRSTIMITYSEMFTHSYISSIMLWLEEFMQIVMQRLMMQSPKLLLEKNV